MTRPSTIARVAALLLSVITLAACDDHGGADAAQSIDVQAPGLRQAVTNYYSAVFTGDYIQAFSLRSAVCTKGSTAADFGDDLRSLLNGYSGHPSVTAITVVARAPGSAMVESTLSDEKAPAFLAGPRKWTRIEGQWRFDNCV
jgi:hypothetical protein